MPANNGDKRSIGQRYGAVVKKHDIINRLLAQLEVNPWNRRNVISLWDYEAFEVQQDFSLVPSKLCLTFAVWARTLFGRHFDGNVLTICQVHHINAMQYVALQMMIAKHFGWKVGKFFYFINNLHIYDNQFEQAEELLKRQPSDCQPRLVLNVPDGTNFFDIKPEDFELVDYDPSKPQLKFDLAI